MKVTKYYIDTEKRDVDLHMAVVSDLHSRPYSKVIEALRAMRPKMILLPGDIVEIAVSYMEQRNRAGLEFLQEASKIAPCYYCYGNHEIYYSHAKGGKSKTPDEELSAKYLELIKSYGIHVINDSYEISIDNNCAIGGLVCGRDMIPDIDRSNIPNLRFLHEFDKLEGFKILLCHYPHYYERYLKNTGVDMVLSGHAHGGQWRIFGRGVYAPHQGLFPKYTSGLHDGRHIISRGAVNNTKPIPRFFNPCEILEIRVKSK